MELYVIKCDDGFSGQFDSAKYIGNSIIDKYSNGAAAVFFCDPGDLLEKIGYYWINESSIMIDMEYSGESPGYRKYYSSVLKIAGAELRNRKLDKIINETI
jgi:hypothetical protein